MTTPPTFPQTTGTIASYSLAPAITSLSYTLSSSKHLSVLQKVPWLIINGEKYFLFVTSQIKNKLTIYFYTRCLIFRCVWSTGLHFPPKQVLIFLTHMLHLVRWSYEALYTARWREGVGLVTTPPAKKNNFVQTILTSFRQHDSVLWCPTTREVRIEKRLSKALCEKNFAENDNWFIICPIQDSTKSTIVVSCGDTCNEHYIITTYLILKAVFGPFPNKQPPPKTFAPFVLLAFSSCGPTARVQNIISFNIPP